jgi:hypothetical protein
LEVLSDPDYPDEPGERDHRRDGEAWMTDGAASTGATAGGPLRRLLGSLPRLLLEMLGVVFAVVVALAADEWREDRDLTERAATARQAVLAELAANRDEVERTRESMDSAVARLGEAVRGIEAGESTPVDVDLELPDFSDAAWRITQVTDAASRLDFAWLTRVARVYAAQDLYADVRGEVVRTMASLGSSGPDPGITRLRNQLGIMLQLHRQLVDDYDAVLAEAGG